MYFTSCLLKLKEEKCVGGMLFFWLTTYTLPFQAIRSSASSGYHGDHIPVTGGSSGSVTMSQHSQSNNNSTMLNRHHNNNNQHSNNLQQQQQQQQLQAQQQSQQQQKQNFSNSQYNSRYQKYQWEFSASLESDLVPSHVHCAYQRVCIRRWKCELANSLVVKSTTF